MSSNMHTRSSPWGFGRLLPNVAVANFPRVLRQRPVLAVDELLYIILHEYQSHHSTAFVHNPHTTAEHRAREETFYTESHPLSSQQVTTQNQELVSPLEPLLNDNPWAEDVTGIVFAGPATADGERSPRRSAIMRTKLVRALVGGTVLLIVLPGIILGVLVKQTTAGIALSSAITALGNLFAGLYYYLNKRD